MAEQLVLKVNGKLVNVYSSTGGLKRDINAVDNVVSAVVQGDEIHISTVKGKIKIYNALTGALKRVI